jgi:hypothetical protein
MRGLTIFAFPVAVAAGVYLAARPRLAAAVILACALWALGAAWLALPGSCHRVPIDLAEVGSLEVNRCTFRWRVTAPH